MVLDTEKLEEVLEEMGFEVEFNSETPGLQYGDKRISWEEVQSSFDEIFKEGEKQSNDKRIK